MGLFDRAKKLFGIGGGEDEDAPEAEGEGGGAAGAKPSREREDPRVLAAERAGKLDPRRRDRRPPLKEAAPQGPSVEDALAVREAGDKEGAQKILREIDRGGGLRTVLRAAAALEAGDRSELAGLLPSIANDEPRYKLVLQVAAALGDAQAAQPYIERAAANGAPAWALGWAKAMSDEAAVRREGLVELLFADHALARTVAARDLHVAGTEADPDAGARYASFTHGRESIRRFGARAVAALLDEAQKVGRVMRTTLSLYDLDRPALVAFTKELRELLFKDDRSGLAKLLELSGALADRLGEAERAVDWFLRPETAPEAAPFFSSLRRVAKKRALALAWTSPEASLEGRLRQYDVLREDSEIAARIDKLLSPSRLPWFLVRPGATCGWLDGTGRAQLAASLRRLRSALPAELAAFAEAIGDMERDAVAHDAL